ncbi:hypothetical protein [Vineibacter terrae]|uniref:hypothetical protein n=1 Tax=Vineibacter terrae TaxID=2586908 RepID=UPI002E306E4F|nr:hypothetical protein [Vineibacter terrae]HEX2886661.1 hypothetical protein [Vineibacter terrae]
MIGLLCRRLLALVLVLAATAGGARAQAPAAIWSGTSAGFDVQWTTGDIVVRRGQQPVFSARDWAQAGLAHFIDVNRDTRSARPPDCTLTRSLRIVALVGTMMSLEDGFETTCRREAHPGGMTRLLTVNLAKPGSLAQAGRDAIGRVDPDQPGRAVLLTDLFPASDVLAGLAGAPPLRDVLRRAKSTPATLPALLEAVAYASGEGDACYSVPADLLAAFAFARLDGERIVMRLGLPGDGPCRMNLTTADMPFALPESLTPAVRKAAAGQEGFLADRAETIAAGRRTVIELQSGRGAGR